MFEYKSVILVIVVLKLVISEQLLWKQPEERSKLLRLMSVLIGYSNANFYNASGDFDSLLHQNAIPIDIPAFHPSITFLYEEASDEKLLFRQVVVLREGHDGWIYGQPYNFTGMDIGAVGKSDLTLVQGLKAEDFKTSPECTWIMTEMPGNVFIGRWPYCQSIYNGVIPIYYNTWTCGSCVFFTDDLKYKGLKTPTIYYTSVRYPLLPYMLEGAEDFHDPCV